MVEVASPTLGFTSSSCVSIASGLGSRFCTNSPRPVQYAAPRLQAGGRTGGGGA